MVPPPLPFFERLIEMKKLSDRQKIFVREYLTDFNATRSAKSAGYSANGADVTGSRLLVNPKVSEKISKKTLAKLSAPMLQMAARLIVEEKSDGEIAAFLGIKRRALRSLKAGRHFAKRIEKERSILSLEKSVLTAMARQPEA